MANSKERIGVHHCAEIAERNNWLFREQPIDDIGIDAHMEWVEMNGISRQLLAVQIKSGESFSISSIMITRFRRMRFFLWYML